jgi:DNA-binding XRE family transcriptional regulator
VTVIASPGRDGLRVAGRLDGHFETSGELLQAYKAIMTEAAFAPIWRLVISRGSVRLRKGGDEDMAKTTEAAREADNRGVYLPGLRAARQRMGMGQRDLARFVGISPHTVGELENMKRKAYPRTVRRLTALVGVEDLLSE